ncbi:MAG: GNAT family N-acetyltransferase [Rhizobiales bacterium]|nr:GNAT family N-acetyltransferase [Hyphomicrobiales bacterium]
MTLTLTPHHSNAEAADYTASLNEASSGWTASTHGASAPLRAEDIDLRLYTDLDKARVPLDAFARESDRTAFQNFEWLSAWERHIGRTHGVAPFAIVGSDRDGTPLLMLAFGIETRGLARRLTWLGTDQCDYNGPTLHKRFTERFAADGFAALWARIVTLIETESGHTFDIVDLAKMPETIGEQPNPFLAMPTAPNPSGAYITSLGSDWDAFYTEKRSSQTRKKERRQLKHLAEFGAVQFVDVQDTDERRHTLELLFQQKSRALARMGAEDIFASPERRAFYLDIATNDATRDLVHVSRLDIGGVCAAVSVGLRADGRYYLILSSYDDGETSKHGPGRALLHELLRYAIANQFRCFDFTIGDEPYKMDWSDTRLVLHDHLSATTLRGLIVVKALTAFRALKRTIKQNPTMWLAFSKARAAAGNLFSR